MSDPNPPVSPVLNSRYRGIGGVYTMVGDEVFPADEQGNPLPHTRDENGAPLPPPEPPAPTEAPDPQE